MIRIIEKKINMIDELKTKINWSCKFYNRPYQIIEGYLRIVEHTNLAYVEPHKVIIGDTLYLFFNEQKPKKDEYIIENIVKALEENINCLIKVKNKFHHLGYFEDEQAIGTKIEFLKTQNNTLKKYIPHIENYKDNAN